ncbi:hypothetical protein GMO_12760 [Gluconobacter morbifer G707]|uniref:Uncharacterized protein n=1 Tax=Gluconobacter morbifer G707 TaxID=1088869 RepID=G6XI66_9PROT|nr:hypothetical protein GMO_12760 [Gluconobacter morbifer G707]
MSVFEAQARTVRSKGEIAFHRLAIRVPDRQWHAFAGRTFIENRAARLSSGLWRAKPALQCS